MTKAKKNEKRKKESPRRNALMHATSKKPITPSKMHKTAIQFESVVISH